ncbi:Dolichyl-diphosphooligosaccharide--protein glycosyltransferase subunit 1B [Forsythia ovata]|uniref:Dolichyl-diphosphooligosaccharide--protein glycosyltransferase subunit 1 n=1 Tax=Forsythia ovata TaxID=205694 RepID=A0ABD1X0L7_9LAMI
MFLVKTSSSYPSPSPSPSHLQILNAERRIDLTSHIVRVYLTLKVENTGEAPAAEVLLAFPPTQFDRLALVKAAGTVGKKKKKSYLPLEVHPSARPDAPNGTKYYSISLLKPLGKAESITLEIIIY